MKFNITQKLLVVAALPIVTLLVFSATYIKDKYEISISNQLKLTKLDIMQKTSDLIHELQVERGVSVSYLNKTNNINFTTMLKTQKGKTNIKKKEFTTAIEQLDTKICSLATLNNINRIKNTVSNLEDIRKLGIKQKINPKKLFTYYTLLNNQLISLFNSFQFHSNSKKTNSNITILHSLINYKEFAGQERAVVAKFALSKDISTREMRQYHTILSLQEREDSKVHFLLKDNILSSELENIHKKYQNNFFYASRKEIINHEIEKNTLDKIYNIISFGGMIHDLKNYKKTKDRKFYTNFLEKKSRFDTLMHKFIFLSTKAEQNKIAKKLQHSFDNITQKDDFILNDTEILSLYLSLKKHQLELNAIDWFKISTNRIDDIHEIEKKIFFSTFKDIKKDIDTTQNTLIIQIFLTLVSIILLLLGTFYTANRIKNSIKKLEDGLDDFFDFLNAKREKPENIDTHSNDEIGDMAQSINIQMALIEENFQEDKDFINEATQIVMMMKNGDFSERPYFQPHNPHLIELKSVLHELIELISDKIKEQTDELYNLNSSLEDKVFHQTNELNNQVKELTIARDKAIQAEIAKDEFLANMSHEIRTPLNAILGFVTILKKQIKDEKPLKYLNIIDTSGKSLLTIINDILDFSKIQSGKFTISPHAINPVEEMSNAALLFASKAYEKHILYAVYIDPNLPQTISIDAVRVKQIFSNILSNAIKFTPEDGEIKVKVTCQDSKLRISIQDSGIGIAEKNIDKVFSAFEQADGSTTRKYGGTGLGLSISSRLTKLMNGDLSVISKEGKGSTFTLEIPITITNNEPKILIDKNKFKEYTFALLSENKSSKELTLIKKYLSDFGAENIIELSKFQKDGYDLLFFVPDDAYNEDIVYSKKSSIALLRTSSIKLANFKYIQALYAPYIPSAIIQTINDSGIDKIIEHTKPIVEDEDEVQFLGSILVAEDNKTNQMLISLILDDYGLEFKIANNGLEAVEMFKKEKFDLVLMDENMPELNGIGAMKQIKEYENKKSLIMTPIIALTASVLDTDKEMFLNAGMDGFVGKPINNDELSLELSKFLKKKG